MRNNSWPQKGSTTVTVVFESNHPIDVFRFPVVHVCVSYAVLGHGAHVAHVAHSAHGTLPFFDAKRRNVKLLEGPSTSGWNAHDEQRLISGFR